MAAPAMTRRGVREVVYVNGGAEINGAARNRLDALLQGKPHGASVSHKAIAKTLGVPSGSSQYYAKVRAALLSQQQRQRHWRLLPRRGYQLLYPHEAHLITYDQVGRAKSAALRGSVALQHKDSEALPRIVNESYGTTESALRAITDMLGDVESAVLTIESARFIELRAAIKRVQEDFEAASRRAQAVAAVAQARGGVSMDDLNRQARTPRERRLAAAAEKPSTVVVTASRVGSRQWDELRCPHCDRLLLKHAGMPQAPSAAISIKCRACKSTIVLHGIKAAIQIAPSAIARIGDA